mmetsp:Transcript_23268/g.49772  ORF Transcript_23268/g.49772 Transcript_23268/m.49772 type:complete len:160 (+) Transcript_23268:120-599(+)
MTYGALCTLVALGDDLSRVHNTAILQKLQSLQNDDGNFVAIPSNCIKSPGTTAQQRPTDEKEEDDDCDLRFMYTAIVIWFLLADTKNNDSREHESSTTINIQSATSYILSCISHDWALGLTTGREGHGGSTYCEIASKYLMRVLDDVREREELNDGKMI